VKCFPGATDCNNNHGSELAQRQITLNFDEELLGDDAVQVYSPGRVCH
jgi:hypothetical protein